MTSPVHSRFHGEGGCAWCSTGSHGSRIFISMTEVPTGLGSCQVEEEEEDKKRSIEEKVSASSGYICIYQ